MAKIQIAAAQFAAFLNDEEAWKGWILEDVNNDLYDQTFNMVGDKYVPKENAMLDLEDFDGYMENDQKGTSQKVAEAFRQWQQKQFSELLLVRVNKTDLDRIKKAIQQIPGAEIEENKPI